MESKLKSLIVQEKFFLDKYSDLLKQYIDYSHFTIMGKRKPSEKAQEASTIKNDKNNLEKLFGIGWRHDTGMWKLRMVGECEVPALGNRYQEKGYWWIFPMHCNRKEILEYLAAEALPRAFKGDAFYVESTMIPADSGFMVADSG